jgi:hypothetical protein
VKVAQEAAAAPGHARFDDPPRRHSQPSRNGRQHLRVVFIAVLVPVIVIAFSLLVVTVSAQGLPKQEGRRPEEPVPSGAPASALEPHPPASAPIHSATAANSAGGTGTNGLTLAMLKNARYDCDAAVNVGGPIALKDGSYEKTDPVHHAVPRATLDADLVVFGDLNADGREDAVAILYYNGGGTGTWRLLFAMVDDAGSPKCAASLDLGDRTEVHSLDIVGRRILVDFTEHGPEDAMHRPTHRVNAVYEVVPPGTGYTLQGTRFRNTKTFGVTYNQITKGFESFEMKLDERPEGVDVYSSSARGTTASLEVWGSKSDIQRATLSMAVTDTTRDEAFRLLSTFLGNANLPCEPDAPKWGAQWLSRLVAHEEAHRSLLRCADREVILGGVRSSERAREPYFEVTLMSPPSFP